MPAPIVPVPNTPEQAFADSVPEYIKVGLRYGGTAVESCTVYSETGFILGNITEEGFSETLPLPAYTSLVATAQNGSVELHDTSGVLISADIGNNGCLMPSDYKENGLISVESSRYRGGIMLKANPDRKLTVINYLTMDEYLYGVLHREMSQGNPLEALKAQAVTARSFAVSSMGRHSRDGFDVCSTTDCQVYGGCADEYPNTSRAVDETSGLLIWSEGEPAPVYYYKNSGGHTQGIDEVWTSFPQPHLKGVEDPYSPVYPWTAVIDFNVIEQKLTLAGYDPGKIKSVTIGKRNSAGAVSELIISGSKNDIKLEKGSVRSVFGTSLIRSTHFNIGDTYIGTGNKPVSKSDIKIGSGSRIKDAAEQIYVLSANNNIKSVNSSELYMISSSKTVKAKTAEGAVSDFDDSIVAKDGKVTFSGVGYGHGIGMPQDSAIEMAKQGFTFEEILKFYFTDIEVR